MSRGLVLPFLRQVSNSQDWSQQELAEFYRVEGALLQAGFAVSTDRGVTDEGDPWFVFCRADNEEVIAHFARINREYVVVSSFHEGAVSGRDLRALIRQLLDSNPMTLPMRRKQGQKVYLHPAALLTALVASAYVLSNDKQLTGDHAGADGHHKHSSIISLLMEKFSIFAAAALAATWVEQHSGAIAQFFESTLFHNTSDEKLAHGTHSTPDDSALNAILQAVQNAELSNRGAAQTSDGSDLAASHQVHEQGVVALKLAPNSTGVTGEKAPDAGAAIFAEASPGTQFADNIPSHGDNPTSGAAVQLAIAPRLAGAESAGQPDASSQAPATQSVQSSATASDALHLVLSVTSNQSLQFMAVSDGTISLDQASQQALLHIGFDSTVVHNLVIASFTVDPSDGMSADVGSIGTGTPISISGVNSPTILETQSVMSNPQFTASATPPLFSASGTVESSIPAATVSVSEAPHLTDFQVNKIMQMFFQATPSFEVSMSGTNVVMMDTSAADGKSPDFGGVNFHMHDGSMLLIIGIISGFSHAVAA